MSPSWTDPEPDDLYDRREDLGQSLGLDFFRIDWDFTPSATDLPAEEVDF